MKILLSIGLLLALSGCATQDELRKETVSGYPEIILKNKSIDKVKENIMNKCSSKGALVQDVQSHSVLCGKVLDGNDEFWARLLVGNSYSTTPERKVRFMIFPSGKDVRVTAQEWIETQMPFGQLRKTEMTGNNQRNDMQEFLDSLEYYDYARGNLK